MTKRQASSEPPDHSPTAPDRVGEPSGFGRFGMVERTEDRIMCHECGRWLQALPSHLVRKHAMNARDYKRRHGLLTNEPLWSASLSRNRTQHMRENFVGTPNWLHFQDRGEQIRPSSLKAAHEAARAENLAPANRARLALAARDRFPSARDAYHQRRWLARFEELLRWRESHDGQLPMRRDTDPDADADAASLSRWLEVQRTNDHKGQLSAERRDLITAAGIDLAPGSGSNQPRKQEKRH